MDSAFALVLAMRNAIAAARKDVGNEEWFEISKLFYLSRLKFKCLFILIINCLIIFKGGPVTPEDIAKLCLFNDSQLSL